VQSRSRGSDSGSPLAGGLLVERPGLQVVVVQLYFLFCRARRSQFAAVVARLLDWLAGWPVATKYPRLGPPNSEPSRTPPHRTTGILALHRHRA